MASRVPIPTAAYRAITELLAEIEHGSGDGDIYDTQDLSYALEAMGEMGDEDAAIAHRWLQDHHDDYLQGLVDGFEPI